MTRTIRHAFAANLAEINRVIRASKSHWRQPHEYLQAALRRAGLTEPHLTAGMHALANYVIGSALTQSTAQHIDDSGVRQATRDYLHARRDAYPTLVEVGHLDERDEDLTFEHGLAYLIDGLARHLDR